VDVVWSEAGLTAADELEEDSLNAPLSNTIRSAEAAEHRSELPGSADVDDDDDECPSTAKNPF